MSTSLQSIPLPRANQPSAAVPVHYTPTRLLAGDELDTFRRLGLAPIEQLTDRDIKDCPIPRLKAYITVYRAKISNMRPPRCRQDFDRFFLAWFRHMYDRGEIQPRPALPIYLPQPGLPAPSASTLTQQQNQLVDPWSLDHNSPFTAHTDPGYLKLRPLHRHAPALYPPNQFQYPAPSPRGPQAWHSVFDPVTPAAAADKLRQNEPQAPRPMHEAVAALLQQYGMFGRAWDKLGREAVLRACDFLADYNGTPDPIITTEGVAEFMEELSNITLVPLRRLMNTHDRNPFSVSDTLRGMPLLGNGVCTQLMRGDKSGIRQL